jgi:hypothetical protein
VEAHQQKGKERQNNTCNYPTVKYSAIRVKTKVFWRHVA